MTRKRCDLPILFTQPIGSLPRPQAVLDLLAARDDMDPALFASMLDEMVVFAIRLQELAGLDVVSDGEWRRTHYVGEFLKRVGGCEKARKYEHQGETKFTDVFVRRAERRDPVFVQDAEFLAAHTDRAAKFALPSPFLIAVRFWHKDYSSEAYPTYRHLMDDMAELLAGEAKALAGAGVDVIQIDDPALTYFCDRDLMSGVKSHDARLHRNWDPEREVPAVVEAVNAIVEGVTVRTQLHCCHSVYKRRSDVSGDYKPLLPLLAGLKVDRLNLEFAYRGTGQPDDLTVLPASLGLGMGVIDVRGEVIQSVDEVEELILSGLEMLGPERIALNPDCGFAPDAAEPPSIDEAYTKLRRMTEAAARVRLRLTGTCLGD